MKRSSRIGLRKSTRLVAIGAVCGGLVACGGGSDGGMGTSTGGTGGTGQTGKSAYVYVTTADTQVRQVPGTIYQYSVGTNGSLSPLSVASLATGVTPIAVVTDPAGHYVYVANQGDATISQYAVGSNGALSPLSPATVSITGPGSTAVAHAATVDPTGHFLYVATTAGPPPLIPASSISQYSIGSNGTLTPLSPAYINVPTSTAGPLAIDSSGQHAYLTGAATSPGSFVSQFSIAAGGTLSPQSPATVAATTTTIGVTIAPSGRAAYVLSACVDNACTGQVAQYSIGTSGTLTPTSGITATGGHVNPVAMVIDGVGSSAYLLTNLMGVDTNQGALYQYTIDSTGSLKPGTPASLSLASGAVAESTDGRNLYALSANARGAISVAAPGGQVYHFIIGSGGMLTPAETTSIVVGLPTAIALVAVQ